MFNDENNQKLKQKIIERSNNQIFRHHKWFVKYHLEIVERISQELCERYPVADRYFVHALVWLHDYEKVVDFDNQYNTELAATRSLMEEVGYSSEAIEKMAQSINQYNSKENLKEAIIEVQIVSSSDAASHLVGPFFTLWWYENPSKSIEELQADNKSKLTVDWKKKITLPEIKRAFEHRHNYMLEMAGDLPTSFLQ